MSIIPIILTNRSIQCTILVHKHTNNSKFANGNAENNNNEQMKFHTPIIITIIINNNTQYVIPTEYPIE
jgi:hypothetical protein